jgi:GGDEF domain-containing protein
VGSPYRHRLGRLRQRLAFDANPNAMKESRMVVDAELAEYGHRAALYVDRHGVELRRGLAGLEEIVRTLAQRQDFYGARLRQFAAQMETTPYPTDPDHMAEVVALQATGLLSVVESMSHESQSLAVRMREELQQVERRLAEAEITDPITGLMNRREWERRLAEVISEEQVPTLLLFDFSCQLPDEVARQVGVRMTAQFRHNDLIARWSEHQFVVLFQGSRETACERIGQIVQWIAGQYPLDAGGTLEIAVDVQLVDAAQLAEPD